LALVTKDTIGLSCARLPIGQEGSIVAIKDSLDQMAAIFVQLFLVTWVHDMVESEYLLFVIFPLNVNGVAIDLYLLMITSTISSMSLSL
jgi:hypothetical protein